MDRPCFKDMMWKLTRADSSDVFGGGGDNSKKSERPGAILQDLDVLPASMRHTLNAVLISSMAFSVERTVCSSKNYGALGSVFLLSVSLMA